MCVIIVVVVEFRSGGGGRWRARVCAQRALRSSAANAISRRREREIVFVRSQRMRKTTAGSRSVTLAASAASRILREQRHRKRNIHNRAYRAVESYDFCFLSGAANAPYSSVVIIIINIVVLLCSTCAIFADRSRWTGSGVFEWYPRTRPDRARQYCTKSRKRCLSNRYFYAYVTTIIPRYRWPFDEKRPAIR